MTDSRFPFTRPHSSSREMHASQRPAHHPLSGMSQSRRVCFRIGLSAAVMSAVLVSCKQGRGDRCQVDDDCSQGLICNKATDTCQETGGGGDIDATVPDALIDAPVGTPDLAPSSGPKYSSP